MIGTPGIEYRITGAAVTKDSASEKIRASEGILASDHVVYGKVCIILWSKRILNSMQYAGFGSVFYALLQLTKA